MNFDDAESGGKRKKQFRERTYRSRTVHSKGRRRERKEEEKE